MRFLVVDFGVYPAALGALTPLVPGQRTCKKCCSTPQVLCVSVYGLPMMLLHSAVFPARPSPARNTLAWLNGSPALPASCATASFSVLGGPVAGSGGGIGLWLST
eukprot:1247637-Rhodomonas_salina.2